MSRIGIWVILVLLFLSPGFFAAAAFYPKSEDAHYKIEQWLPLGTAAVKKLYRRLGWACLSLAVLLIYSCGLV